MCVSMIPYTTTHTFHSYSPGIRAHLEVTSRLLPKLDRLQIRDSAEPEIKGSNDAFCDQNQFNLQENSVFWSVFGPLWCAQILILQVQTAKKESLDPMTQCSANPALDIKSLCWTIQSRCKSSMLVERQKMNDVFIGKMLISLKYTQNKIFSQDFHNLSNLSWQSCMHVQTFDKYIAHTT